MALFTFLSGFYSETLTGSLHPHFTENQTNIFSDISQCEQNFRCKRQNESLSPHLSSVLRPLSSVHHLKIHMRRHTGKQLQSCDVCGCRFNMLQNWNRHRHTHTGRNSLCSICGKAFTRAAWLKTHKVIHTREKPYECDQCPKAFLHGANLKKPRGSTAARSHTDASTARGSAVNSAGRVSTTRCIWRFSWGSTQVSVRSVSRAAWSHTATSTWQRRCTLQRLWSRLQSSVRSEGSREDPHWQKPFICKVCSRAFILQQNQHRHTHPQRSAVHLWHVWEGLQPQRHTQNTADAPLRTEAPEPSSMPSTSGNTTGATPASCRSTATSAGRASSRAAAWGGTGNTSTGGGVKPRSAELSPSWVWLCEPPDWLTGSQVLSVHRKLEI